MNKETENKELEPILEKLRGMEEALKVVDTRIDSFVVPAIGARVDGLMQILSNEREFYDARQEALNHLYFVENVKVALLVTAISLSVSSFFAGMSFLIMAIGSDNPGYWGAFAGSSVVFVAAQILGLRYRPGSIKVALKRLRSKIRSVYRTEKAASVFDGLISAIEQEVRAVENAIKLEREKQSPNSDRLADLEGTLAKFKEQKAAYERSKRELGI